MQPLRVFIEKDELYAPEAASMLQLFGSFSGLPVVPELTPGKADVTIGHSENNDIRISREFFSKIGAGVFDHHRHFSEAPLIMHNGQPDYFSTVFYMVNGLQEYNRRERDGLGRFPYAASYQKKFGVVQKNLAGEYIELLLGKMLERREDLSLPTQQPSRIFISHDIDNVYGSAQDLFHAVKKVKLADIIRTIISVVVQRPTWLNFDKVMDINDEFDLKSMFLFIVHKGRTGEGLVNADYAIDGRNIRGAISRIKERGFEIGLHKSVAPTSFSVEIERLREPVICNRYHYLRFDWPDAIPALEKSGLAVDCSFGFAEAYGFRNNYSRPFIPYNLAERRPSSFVEVPLHVMDRTFYSYRKDKPEAVADEIISFFEAHRTGAVLSLLWHNNFYTSVKFHGYLAALKKILGYLHDVKITSVSARELRDNYLKV